jgi:hypothetical protein
LRVPSFGGDELAFGTGGLGRNQSIAAEDDGGSSMEFRGNATARTKISEPLEN